MIDKYKKEREIMQQERSVKYQSTITPATTGN